MNNVANKLICLNLNASWQPVGFKTVKDAIVDLCGSESNGKPSTMALDIEYELDENGQPIFREDGKILKGKDYFKPNIGEILARR